MLREGILRDGAPGSCWGVNLVAGMEGNTRKLVHRVLRLGRTSILARSTEDSSTHVLAAVAYV